MLKAQIIGNIGGDPDMKYSANGTPILRFNVASNYRTRTPDGDYQDRVEWVRVTVLGARAESMGQYLRKGSRVYADGRLEARPWTDQQGQIRPGLEIVAGDVQFMSPRNDDEQREVREPATAGSGRRTESQTRQQMGLDDDELPF